MTGNNDVVTTAAPEANRRALELFAPIAPTYDRYANLLSFGQDRRWRSFLVSRIAAEPHESILDVATGTAAVALELARRYRSPVVAVDQSAEMLAEASRRVEAAGEAGRVTLVHARAEELPFPRGAFDGLTFTYLLRYVEHPGAVLRELARVVRPGGRIAGLEFGVPAARVARALWRAYVDVGLPLAGAAVSPAWRNVGSFLGPSIREFWRRYPLETLLDEWRAAGIDPVYARPMSLGGGVVFWGRRAG